MIIFKSFPRVPEYKAVAISFVAFSPPFNLYKYAFLIFLNKSLSPFNFGSEYSYPNKAKEFFANSSPVTAIIWLSFPQSSSSANAAIPLSPATAEAAFCDAKLMYAPGIFCFGL